MKRRTFIKGMIAAALSPFIARGTITPKAAIPDPRKLPGSPIFTGELGMYEGVTIHENGFEMNHLHDSLQYSAVMDPGTWTDTDRGFFKGDQWPASFVKRMARDQRKVNFRRSRLIDQMSKYKFNRIKGL